MQCELLAFIYVGVLKFMLDSAFWSSLWVETSLCTSSLPKGLCRVQMRFSANCVKQRHSYCLQCNAHAQECETVVPTLQHHLFIYMKFIAYFSFRHKCLMYHIVLKVEPQPLFHLNYLIDNYLL